MAYVTSTSGIFAGRTAPRKSIFGAVFDTIREGYRSRAIYNRTVSELNALSDRELADIGISRSMITRVALEAAYDL